jgi:hypothetical protein
MATLGEARRKLFGESLKAPIPGGNPASPEDGDAQSVAPQLRAARVRDAAFGDALVNGRLTGS